MHKLDGSAQWSFTYNADGLPTQRTNGTRDYCYTYLGGQLTHMTVDNHTLYFTYDAAGVPLSLTYDGETYYYITNLQGDVISIINGNGQEFVRYTYDAWGKLLSVDGTATNLRFYNPLRYRGYVYDPETELYYLQSRYYNPEMGRFINGDNQLVGVGGDPLGYNIFAYCMSSPVNMSDSSGNWPKLLVDASNAVETFFKKTWSALSNSCSISGEVGHGYGIKGKVGSVSLNATAIIVGDEWTMNSDGTSESIRKGSLTVQAEVIDNVNAGVDLEYSVPLDEGEAKGLWGADGGEFDIVAGVYAGNFGLGYNTMPARDMMLSFGLSGYLFLGGGFEVSLNLSKFIEIWNQN